MKQALTILLLLFANAAFGQETTIRILGAYPAHLSRSASTMTTHLQAIASTWNNSGLPGASVTTVQLLNSAIAVPVSYPSLPSTAIAASNDAWLQPSMTALRKAWQADVIILFTAHTERCGAAIVAWGNNNFSPDAQGLDLNRRHDRYIAVVNNDCDTYISAHEFGHLGGAGHASSGSRLYSNSRAHVEHVQDPEWDIQYYFATALWDPLDCPADCPLYPGLFMFPLLHYSRDQPGYGNAGHNNVQALSMTARSLANFYEYPSVSPVLYPPVNLHGINLGCVNGVETRHDLYWSNDPGTTAEVSHFEIWKSQPIGNPFVYGWTVYGPYTPSYQTGVAARARVNACSGPTCSDLSVSYYDAATACGNW